MAVVLQMVRQRPESEMVAVLRDALRRAIRGELEAAAVFCRDLQGRETITYTGSMKNNPEEALRLNARIAAALRQSVEPVSDDSIARSRW